MAHLYSELAQRLARNIDDGVYQPGERLPGVRVTSIKAGVSNATAVAAYRQLEAKGYIESRPRSGFFVRARSQLAMAEPAISKVSPRPRPVSGQQHVLQLAQASGEAGVLNLGAAVPDASFLPTTAISRALSRAAYHHRQQLSTYAFPPGVPSLRQQIAKRMAEAGCRVRADEIVITHGCQEALYLSLKALTKPGDLVALESPTYYSLLQLLEALGLKAIEIPTHPREGVSIEALQLALEQWPIKVCVLIPNFNNPMGSLMSDTRKRALLKLIHRFPDVHIIEDDVYGDLNFEGRRPSILQSFDRKQRVVYCSSFSKTLAPGLRLGWIAAPGLSERLQFEKFVANCASPTITQLAVAELLSSGRYERHLRTMRLAIAESVAKMSEQVARYFPSRCKISRPAGGYVIWLELPKGIDAMELSHRAREEGISIAPGPLFSATQKFRNCIRLSCAVLWSDKVEKGIKRLGELVGEVS